MKKIILLFVLFIWACLIAAETEPYKVTRVFAGQDSLYRLYLTPGQTSLIKVVKPSEITLEVNSERTVVKKTAFLGNTAEIKNISIVLDNSLSMKDKYANVQKALTSFQDSLSSDFYLSLYDYGDGRNISRINESEASLITRKRLFFSNSPFLIKKEIANIPSFTDKTYTNDALVLAVADLNEQPRFHNKYLFIIVDGEDNGSSVSNKDLVGVLKNSDVSIYVLDIAPKPTATMERMCLKFNGFYTNLSSEIKLEGQLQTILQQIRKTILLDFPINDFKQEPNLQFGIKFPQASALNSMFYTFEQKFDLELYEKLETSSTKQVPVLADYAFFLDQFKDTPLKEKVLFMWAEQCYKQGDFAQAGYVFNSLSSNQLAVHKNYAKCYLSLLNYSPKNLTKTVDEINKSCSEINSLDFLLKMSLQNAKLLFQNNEYQKCIQVLDGVISSVEDNSVSADCYWLKYRCSQQLKSDTLAVQSLRKIIAYYPYHKLYYPAKNELARKLRQESKSGEIVDLFQELQTSVPGTIDSLKQIALHYAWALNKEKKYAQLFNFTERVIPIFSDPVFKSYKLAALSAKNYLLMAPYFDKLTKSEKSFVLKNQQVTEIAFDGNKSSFLPNGAYVNLLDNLKDFSIVTDSLILMNYPAWDCVYQFGESLSASTIYLPMTDSLVSLNNQSDLYLYYDDGFKLTLLTFQLNEKYLSFRSIKAGYYFLSNTRLFSYDYTISAYPELTNPAPDFYQTKFKDVIKIMRTNPTYFLRINVVSETNAAVSKIEFEESLKTYFLDQGIFPARYSLKASTQNSQGSTSRKMYLSILSNPQKLF